MKVKASSASGELNGFLDAGSHMKGELHFEDTFRVDGKFTGTVISNGNLVVGAGGEVEGEIRVTGLFVSGVVRGLIAVAKRVEIAAGGRVFGDIESPSLILEDGAFFEGQCSMAGSAPGDLRPAPPIPIKQ